MPLARLVVSSLLLAIAASQTPGRGREPWVADTGAGTYRNPILHADYSDPDVVRVGDDYYMTASSFTCAPGLPILHSRDLVNWRLIGHALRRQVPEDVFSVPQHGKGCWAPAIRHHERRFRIYYPDPDFGIYVVTATRPEGPWTDPVLVKGGKGLIDPCPLWDDDGQVYLVHAWARSRAGFANILTLNRLSPDGLRTIDEGRTVINGDQIPGYTTLEGPKFYKRDGYYWIFAPAGGVQRGWQSAFRSKGVDGPYEHRIVLHQGGTDINGPHQGAWVQTPKGDHWFFHFQDMAVYGRVVHLQPMTWHPDGWPVMGTDADGDGTGEPIRTWRKPDVGRRYPIVVPQTSDEFDGLGLQWQWQANPASGWASPSHSDQPGVLRLYSRPAIEGGSLWSVPHLLLQKFPAPEFVATTALRFSHEVDGESAGLVVFGQDYAWLGLRRVDGTARIVVRVAKDAQKGSAEVQTATIETDADVRRQFIHLRVTVAQGGRCRFNYSVNNRSFQPLGDEFVARQGVWVGAKVGIFALAPPGAKVGGYAEWDWFRVTPR
jgi:beta-xylosidase